MPKFEITKLNEGNRQLLEAPSTFTSKPIPRARPRKPTGSLHRSSVHPDDATVLAEGHAIIDHRLDMDSTCHQTGGLIVSQRAVAIY
jgi:hypothetical protein